MTGERWIFRGVRVLDPFRGLDAEGDVAVADGVFAHPADAVGAVPVDAKGLWLVPRVTDLHVHFRDPGQTWKEDLHSGCRAAAAGGVTTVGVMPNTVPVTDSAARLAAVRERLEALGAVRPWMIGAVTAGSAGGEPAPWDDLAAAGAVALSDDGHPVARAAILGAVLAWSRRTGRPLLQHAEEPDLSAGGHAHAGDPARDLGIPGVPAAAEAAMVWRDVGMLREVGGRLHVCHVSTDGALEAVAWAVGRGLDVSAEATPHHLLLTDEALREWAGSAVTKVNPPLRPARMRAALRRAVRTGLVGVVASDHAPHAAEEKARPYPEAPFGISGLETLLGVVLTVLVHEEGMPPLTALARVTVGPHRVVGRRYPGVRPGAPADLTLVDPDAAWVVDPARFVSRGHNTPLAGVRLRGRPVATMVGGRFTFRDGEVLV
ncbi:MAG: dihydroorotase [Actinomycetia bacterium]|nr:dihydroorotase [Actinomycetes bacterium]